MAERFSVRRFEAMVRAAYGHYHAVKNDYMALAYPSFVKRLLKAAVPMALKRHLHELTSANSVEVCLDRLKNLGFRPACVVDVGAYEGNWTRMARRVFPQAQFLMIEALEEKRPHLEGVKKDFPDSTVVDICLLGSEMKKEVRFFVMETGSSMFQELTSAQRRTRMLTTRTLDHVLAEHEIADGPMLLKLDVQGAELEVLAGAHSALSRAPVVLLEVSVAEYNKGAPRFDDVLGFMGRRGYRLFDIAALIRPDGVTLVQMDAVFINDGALNACCHPLRQG